MEMKHRQKHISLRCSNKGFTMVELLVAMVVALLALGAIYSTFLNQQKSYVLQQETAAMHQNIRAAMFYMQGEIRMAGCDPKGKGIFGVTSANYNQITFTEDVNDGAGGQPDGILNPNETISYTLNNGNLLRNGVVVAQNIDAINFVYWGNASPPNVLNAGLSNVTPGTENQIRMVEITIVARTNDQLLYGTKNNRAYLNQQGSQIYVAPGDHVSRRRLTSYIKGRNLGL